MKTHRFFSPRLPLSLASASLGALLCIAGLCIAGCAGAGGPAPVRDAGTGEMDAGDVDAGPTEAECGDLICSEELGESCTSCEFDCGECPVCDEAPTCSGALATPTSSEALEECNNGDRTNYACGSGVGQPVEETNCSDPDLRIRIRQIRIRRSWAAIERQLYCTVTAEDGMHSELLVSRLYNAPSGDSEFNIPVSQATFWGQGELYRSVSNLTLTYECYLASNADTYEGILGSISDTAADVAEHGDGYGWVFGGIAIAADIIGGALGAGSDEMILNVQQIIEADALLELSNARTWTIRASDPDIELDVESWGCATAVRRLE